MQATDKIKVHGNFTSPSKSDLTIVQTVVHEKKINSLCARLRFMWCTIGSRVEEGSRTTPV